MQEGGIFDAIQKNYVASVQLTAYKHKCNPSQVVECWMISLQSCPKSQTNGSNAQNTIQLPNPEDSPYQNTAAEVADLVHHIQERTKPYPTIKGKNFKPLTPQVCRGCI
jgi:hypothetical protein